MTERIGEQGAAITAVTNPDTTVSGLGAAGYLQAAIADAIANGRDNASASRLGAQGRIYAIAGGGEISPGLSGGIAWSPSALFASSEVGVWYDPSDLSTMFQNSDGTTAVAVGDPVGYIADKSGNGKHATQATAASRPLLDTANLINYDGTDDLLTASNPDLGLDVTIARATAGGVSILTGQTVGANYVDNTDHYGLVIVNRALTAGETTSLTTYLEGFIP